MAGMPPPPMNADPYASTASTGFLPPGGDPSMVPPPFMPGPTSSGPSYGIPPPGSNADPYSMSSFAPGMPPPSSVSPALTDPYAPGGAFASPTGGYPQGAPAGFNPGAPNSSTYSGGPSGMYGTNLPIGRAMLPAGASRFRHPPIPSPPKGLPRWFKWAAGASLLILAAYFLINWLRGKKSSPVPQSAPSGGAVTCAPTPSCPPLSSHPQPRAEEFTLRLAKDDSPLVIRVQEDRQDTRRGDDEGRHRDRRDDQRERNRDSRDEERDMPQPTSQPPVIIVNEATPSTRQPQQPPDLWEMTYASDAGGGGGPRMSDTNMVYTRVGGPL